VGGTELRILLAAVNVLVLFRPRLLVGESSWLAFDVLGVGAATTLGVLALVAGVRGTRALARAEGWAPPLQPAASPRVPARDEGRCEGEALSLL
jgi:hypothetical protein